MGVEIFTGPGCAECVAAKALLRDQGIAFVERDVSDATHRRTFASRLPRARSIPQLFVDGVHLGGLHDLRLAVQRGTLGATADVDPPRTTSAGIAWPDVDTAAGAQRSSGDDP